MSYEDSMSISHIHVWLYYNHHHYHHVALLARISLTLSQHPSLSSIAPGRSSKLHPVSEQGCFILVPSWSSYLCSSMWKGPQKYIVYEFVLTFPAVSCMSGSSNIYKFFCVDTKNYGSISWMLIQLMEKKLDGNYTRMLRAVLNKSWGKHPTK